MINKEIIESLIKLSIKGLEKNYYNKNNKIFCFKLKKTEKGYILKGESIRYTLIALLGLIKASQNGYSISLPINEIFELVLRKINDFDNLEDLGLLLWVDSILENKFFDTIMESILSYEKKLTTKNTPYSTGTLAWILTACCYAYRNRHGNSNLREYIFKTKELLLKNFNKKTNLFRAYSSIKRKNKFYQLIKNRITSFAAQIYPIYALSVYGETFSDKETIETAVSCADTLIKLQGNQGQWWWLYNSISGKLAEKYPVYSVHQDGMAPMALIKLSEVSGRNYMPYIKKGLSWLFGKNELGTTELINWKDGIIWRAIQRENRGREYNWGINFTGYCNILLSSLGLDFPIKEKKMEILFESRPYHLGWLLYALTDKKVI